MKPSPQSPAVKVSGLSFTYQDAHTPALTDINIQIPRGSYTLLLGGSSSGKTTLLWSLARVVPEFHPGEITGKIEILGEQSTSRSPQEMAPYLGLIMQDFASQLFSSEVTTEVAFLPENLGLPYEELARRVAEALQMVGLSHLVGRDPQNLSGGERQRLAIASVLSGEAPILVFDEAKSDLDPAGRRQIDELCGRLCRGGNTIISAEVEVEEGAEADLAILLSEGRIVAKGSPKEVFARPDELLRCGIRPLDVTLLADEGGAPPQTVEEALQYLKERDIHPHPKADDPKSAKPEGEEIASLEGVSFTYPRSDAGISDIDLSVRRGEFIALVGANGSGKTTLVKQLNRLLTPQQGNVYVGGRPISEYDDAELASMVGYLFQDPDHQIFHEQVKEEVGFGLRNLKLSEEETSSRTREVLELMELAELGEEDPYSLNKGQRQRLALASVLAMHPQLLILDEPTTGLDYLEVRRLMSAVEEMNRRGITVIAITHAMWLVARYTHRVAVMSGGKKVFDGTPEELFADEELLSSQMLSRPQIVELSLRLGRYCPTVEEFRRTFTWKGAER